MERLCLINKLAIKAFLFMVVCRPIYGVYSQNSNSPIAEKPLSPDCPQALTKTQRSQLEQLMRYYRNLQDRISRNETTPDELIDLHQVVSEPNRIIPDFSRHFLSLLLRVPAETLPSPAQLLETRQSVLDQITSLNDKTWMKLELVPDLEVVDNNKRKDPYFAVWEKKLDNEPQFIRSFFPKKESKSAYIWNIKKLNDELFVVQDSEKGFYIWRYQESDISLIQSFQNLDSTISNFFILSDGSLIALGESLSPLYWNWIDGKFTYNDSHMKAQTISFNESNPMGSSISSDNGLNAELIKLDRSTRLTWHDKALALWVRTQINLTLVQIINPNDYRKHRNSYELTSIGRIVLSPEGNRESL